MQTTLVSLTRSAFGLLNLRERRKVLFLVAALAITGLIDAIALASVMPVITVIVEPELIERYASLGLVREVFPNLSSGDFVVGATLAAGFLLILSTSLSMATSWANGRFGAAIQARLAYDLMLAAMRAPFAWHLKQNSAMLVRFFHSDITRWGRDFIQRLIAMAQHLIGIAVPLALVLIVAPGAGLLSILTIGSIGILLARLVQPRIGRAAGASRLAGDRLVVVANNATSGVKDVKLAGQEVQFSRQFADILGYAARVAASTSAWALLPGAMLLLLGQLALLALALTLWVSGLSHGAIAAQMALVVLVTTRVIPAANRFLGMFSSMSNALPWVDEVIRVQRELAELNAQEQSTGAPAASESWQALVLEGVAFSYPGKPEPAVDVAALAIQRGQSYGIVGMSGAGKSTLVDLLIGLHRPSKGDIRLDGKSLYDFDMKSWQHQIGYVPQSPYIADDTLMGNVALGVPSREIDQVRVGQCLEQANLGEFVAGLPLGFKTPVGDRGVRMSGGQRQRLAIARAFYQNPRILVLDEATSSLDSVSENEVQQAFAHLRGNVTLLVIAHRLSTVRQCDQIIYMERGRVAARGTYDELLSGCPGFRLLASQLEQATQ